MGLSMNILGLVLFNSSELLVFFKIEVVKIANLVSESKYY